MAPIPRNWMGNLDWIDRHVDQRQTGVRASNLFGCIRKLSLSGDSDTAE